MKKYDACKYTTEQQAVIDARECNLLVSAAAGSGKTAVLVEHIISLLKDEKKKTDIDRLLIVTFTKAAAAEMKERIGTAIEDKLREEPDSEHFQRQAALLHTAHISTIDSFCLYVVHSFFHKLPIDPSFRVADESELKLMREDVLDTVFDSFYEEQGEEFLQLTESYGTSKSDRNVKDAVFRMVGLAVSYPWPREWLMNSVPAFSKDIREAPFIPELLNKISLYFQDVRNLLIEAKAVANSGNGPYAYVATLDEDIRFVTELETAANTGFWEVYQQIQGQFSRLSSKRQECDAGKKEYAKALRDNAKKIIEKIRTGYFGKPPEELQKEYEASLPALRTLARVALAYYDAFSQEKRNKNLMDFSDIEHYALDILVSHENGETVPTETARLLSTQFDEIMIDEYQDSNLVQETILNSISKERDGRHNIFMVGDVKQSIYKFRMAKPELFMEKYDTYKESGDLRKIELHKNFRSRACVLDSINAVFRQLMRYSLCGIEYDDNTALNPGAQYSEDLPEHTSELYLIDEIQLKATQAAGTDTEDNREDAEVSTAGETHEIDTDTAAGETYEPDTDTAAEEEALSAAEKNRVQTEAYAVAARIRELTNKENGLKLYDKGSQSVRTANYGDIVILLRTMAGWAEEFLEVLTAEGIPVGIETQTGYFTSTEIRTVLQMIRILDNPYQDIPFAAVLYSPICGLTSRELAYMCAGFGTRLDENGTAANREYLYDTVLKLAASEHYEAPMKTSTEPSQEAISSYKSAKEKINRFLSIYEALQKENEYLPVHLLLEQIYQKTGYADTVLAMPSGSRRRANLDMLVTMAHKFEKTGYQGLYDFVRYMEKQQKYEIDYGEAADAASTGKEVRIMSIHKSKGLEFPVVILSGISKLMNMKDTAQRILMHSDYGIAGECVDTVLRTKTPTIYKKYLSEQLKHEMLCEELRVLYVALTRAREKLIVTGCSKNLNQKLKKLWERVPENTEKGISLTALSQVRCYLDYLYPAIYAGGKNHPSWVIRFYDRNDVVRETAMHTEETEALLMKLKEEVKLRENTEGEHPYLKALRERKEAVYAYGAEALLPIKVSVSELKHRAMEEEGEMFVPHPLLTGEKEDDREETDRGEINKDTLTGSDRGTFYHFLMEKLIFKKDKPLEEIKTETELMIQKQMIQREHLSCVQWEDITTFFRSELAHRMTEADADGRRHTEQPFVIGVPGREIFPETDTEELLLIQGIIDAWFTEPDGIVLMDYKTDRVRESDGEDILKKRYRAQLALYARALGQITGQKVKEQWIYSFSLGRAFRVE